MDGPVILIAASTGPISSSSALRSIFPSENWDGVPDSLSATFSSLVSGVPCKRLGKIDFYLQAVRGGVFGANGSAVDADDALGDRQSETGAT